MVDRYSKVNPERLGMVNIVQVSPGALVKTQDGVRCIVKRLESSTKAVIRNLITGDDEVIDIIKLQSLHETTRRFGRDLEAIDNEEFDAAYEKYQAIRRLVDIKVRSVEDVDLVAKQSHVNRSTVYRWVAEFEKGELVTNLLRKKRRDIGSVKINPAAEKLIGQVIVDFWLTTQRRSIRNTHRELVRLCRQENIPAPSYNTFRARLDKLDQGIAALKRSGEKAAQRFRVTEGTVPNADYPYSVIQIDHTFLDVMLVDEEHRIAIGRPWITVAIDVFSRMVVGYYVSFDPPGTLGTGICIANAILPKINFLAKFEMTVRDC